MDSFETSSVQPAVDPFETSSPFAQVLAALLRPSAKDVGPWGRVARYAVTGGTVAAVYLLVTLLLSTVAGLAFQAALAIGFATALATHFTLQRSFVWARERDFALPLRAQAGRYLAVSLSQYGLTAAATATLPGALGVSTQVVYVAFTAVLTVTSFILFRTRVFHSHPA